MYFHRNGVIIFMMFISMKYVKEGMVIGKSLYDDDLKLIIKDGIKLRKNQIDKIISLGYMGIYIADEQSDELDIQDIVREDLRNTAFKTVKEIFINKNSENDNLDYLPDISKVNDVISEIIEELLSKDVLLIDMMNLKTYDGYTFYHSVNVAIISLVIGIELGIEGERLKKLGIGALFHDIGKMFVEVNILNKKAKLTTEEFEEIKNHSRYGYEYIKGKLKLDEDIFECILQHHERYDGTGYPDKLNTEKINIFARIIIICDVYDALVSNRTYREGILPSEAIEYIMANSGIMFDPKIVKAFIKKVVPFPIGTIVKLSNGLVGIVARNYEQYGMRPSVKVIRDINNNKIDYYYINLKDDMNYSNVTIIKILPF